MLECLKSVVGNKFEGIWSGSGGEQGIKVAVKFC